MNHTPGPWRSCARLGDDWESVVYIPNTPNEICQCFHARGKEEECEANARLIASAPELYEALKALKGYLLNALIDVSCGTKKQTTIATIEGGMKLADAAIARAEGHYLTPVGVGALFDRDAEKRFRTVTRDRYRSLCLRMARKKIPVPFTEEEFRARILAQLGGNCDGAVGCRYCRNVCDLSDAAIDHAEPFARGGSPGVENLECICAPCNDRKGELLPAEYELLLAFLERELPFGRTDVLKRLQKATKLAAGMRHNMGRISELKKSGQWQKAGRAMRKPKMQAEEF